MKLFVLICLLVLCEIIVHFFMLMADDYCKLKNTMSYQR